MCTALPIPDEYSGLRFGALVAAIRAKPDFAPPAQKPVLEQPSNKR